MTRKVEYLTPKSFLKLKLSEAIRQVILDVKSMQKKGIEIYMDDWFQTDANELEDEGSNAPPKVCQVCLGGAAVCSFFEPSAINGYRTIQEAGRKLLGLPDSETEKITNTFEYIRIGEIGEAFTSWTGESQYSRHEWIIQCLEDWFTDEQYSFNGILEDNEIDEMCNYLTELADRFESIGY